MSVFTHILPLSKFIYARKGVKPYTLKNKEFKNCTLYLDINALEDRENKQYTFNNITDLADENDVLMVWDGARCGLVFKGKSGAIGSTMMCFTPIRLTRDYLYYFLKSKFEFINNNTTGSGITHVNQELLFNIEIPYAPIHIQNNIVKKLEEKLEVNNSLLEKQSEILQRLLLETKIRFNYNPTNGENPILSFKKAVLQQAVSGNLLNSKKSRTKGIMWPIIKTKDIFEFVTSGSRNWSDYYSKEGANFIRIGNLNRMSIDLDLKNVMKVKIDGDIEGKRTALRENDILISITGSDLGLVGIVPKNFPESYINQHIALARPKDSYLSKYIAWALLSDYCKTQILEKDTGDTRGGLTLNDIRSINIPIPPIEEQYEIVNKIEELFEVSNNIEKSYLDNINNLENIAKSILQEAFEFDYQINKDPESEESLLQELEKERKQLEKKTAEKRRSIKMNKQKLIGNEANKLPLIDIIKNSPDQTISIDEVWKESIYYESEEVDKFYHELASLKNVNASFEDDQKLKTILTLKKDAD